MCRIANIIPTCEYREDGIDLIRLLDFDDFAGYRYEGDGTYENCRVAEVLRSGEFVDIASPEGAKYTSTMQRGVYTHTIETFVGQLSAELAASLHLATKRRYIVLFRVKGGQFFTFAPEAGAKISYTSRTEGGAGSLVSITAASMRPLFEAAATAQNRWILATGRWGMEGVWVNNETWRYY